MLIQGQLTELTVDDSDVFNEVAPDEVEPPEETDDYDFSSSTSPEGETDKFDFEIARPVAYDLEVLAPTSEIAAAVKASASTARNVLVIHGLTPFAKPGQRPRRVAELGYETRIDHPDSQVVGFAPKSFVRQLGTVGISLGLTAGGILDLGAGVISGPHTQIPGIAGVSVAGKVETTGRTEANAQLSVSLNIQAVRVQSGPTASPGGVRWQLYKDRESLAVFQPLVQVVSVPRDVGELTITSQAWIRRQRSLMRRAPVWITEPVECRASITT